MRVGDEAQNAGAAAEQSSKITHTLDRIFYLHKFNYVLNNRQVGMTRPFFRNTKLNQIHVA